MKPTSLPRIAATATVLSVLLLMALPKAHAETETVLYSFCSVGEFCNDGEIPGISTPTFGLYGNLYGTTPSGGANGGGAVFGLYPEPAGGCESGSNTGNGWCEFVLYSFCSIANCADGVQPEGNLAFLNGNLRRPGNLYGTTFGTSSCFRSGCGTVFEIFFRTAFAAGLPQQLERG